MDLFAEILKQGSLGLVAAVFGYLWLKERADRKASDALYIQALKDSLASKDKTLENITTPLSNIAQGVKLLTDKIVTGKGQL